MGELDKGFDGTMSPEEYYELGLKCSTGEAGQVDLIKAHSWFNIAAMQGHQIAREWRSELAEEMSAADIAAAQRQAREWLHAH